MLERFGIVEIACVNGVKSCFLGKMETQARERGQTLTYPHKSRAGEGEGILAGSDSWAGSPVEESQADL